MFGMLLLRISTSVLLRGMSSGIAYKGNMLANGGTYLYVPKFFIFKMNTTTATRKVRKYTSDDLSKIHHEFSFSCQIHLSGLQRHGGTLQCINLYAITFSEHIYRGMNALPSQLILQPSQFHLYNCTFNLNYTGSLLTRYTIKG